MRKTKMGLKGPNHGRMRVWVSIEAHQYLKAIALESQRNLGTQLDLTLKKAYLEMKEENKKARDRRKKSKG